MEILSIHNLDEHAVLKWRISDSCNYHCPYCIRRPLGNIEHDRKVIQEALPHIKRLAQELEANSGKKIKVDLIGGEVTLFNDLADIINSLAGPVVKVNLTTNFSRPLEWWKEFFSNVHIPVSLTCSYHPTECHDLQDFVYKASLVKAWAKSIKIETVLTKTATHIDDLKQLCDEYGVPYQVEEDLLDPTLTGAGCASTKKYDRYKVTFSNGTVKKFKTRNSFLKQYGLDGMMVSTDGYVCTKGYDFLYIEGHEVLDCYRKVPVGEFELYDKPHVCFKPQKTCTLCGNMSLYKKT